MPKPSYTFGITIGGGGHMNVALARKRHESFCLHYMSTLNGSQSALAAGYCARNPKNAHITAWTLLKRDDVQARLKELAEATTDEAIMTLVQQKIVLSEISRARLIDYQDEHGVIRPLEGDIPNPAAIESVKYKWNPIKKEAYPWRIKLRDPVDAIAQLCKLDNSYLNKKPSASVTVTPITSVAVVEDARTKLTARLDKLSGRITEAKDVPGKQEETSEKASR